MMNSYEWNGVEVSDPSTWVSLHPNSDVADLDEEVFELVDTDDSRILTTPLIRK